MTERRSEAIACVFVVLTGGFWGLYWIPVRRLAETALPGAWGSLFIVALATLLLSPVALRHRHRLAATSPLGLFSLALGGASFLMYSAGLVYGRVAVVILLFYLTPVWSTVIARVWLRRPTPWPRYGVLLTGFAGLGFVLGADGTLPLPRGAGDWLGLASGMLWAVSSTGIRVDSRAGAGESTFVFMLGALAAAVVLAPVMAPWPGWPGADAWLPAAGWVLAAGGLWWALSLTALLWATTRLEPARLGILLMSEVLVGVVSAALLGGEHLDTVESVGGGLVLAAAVLELWLVAPSGRSRPAG